MHGAGVAAAANGGGNFNPRDNGVIIRVGRMIGGRSMAVLVLYAGELWRRSLTDESARQQVTDRAIGDRECSVGKRTRVAGLQLRGENVVMAPGAGLGSDVLRRRA